MTATDWEKCQTRLAARVTGARYVGAIDGIAGPLTWIALVGFAAPDAFPSGDAVTMRGRKLADVSSNYGIDTPSRIAGFPSNTTHETSDYKRSRENLFYTDPARIRAVWPSRFPTLNDARPFARNPEALANKVYARALEGNTQPGDGWAYRGGGDIQLTFRNNYREAGEAIGVPLVAHPELIETPAVALMVGLYYWKAKRLARFYDMDQPKRGRALLNTGNADNPKPIGWADVRARHNRIMELFA